MNKTNSSRLENTELRRGNNYKALGPEGKKALLEAEARKRENTPVLQDNRIDVHQSQGYRTHMYENMCKGLIINSTH